MKITLLVGPGRWFLNYVETLTDELKKRRHNVRLCHHHDEIEPGEYAFFLGYGRIIPKEILKRNKHNLVAHASPLPKGKGSTPLTWQILEGKNDIPVTLFEADEQVDSGSIYDQAVIHFEGHELLHEMHEALGRKIIELVLKFADAYPKVQAKPQTGEATFYPRRKPKDSEVDPDKTLAELFDQFRVADNENYPVFFKYRNHTYLLKIEKSKEHQ